MKCIVLFIFTLSFSSQAADLFIIQNADIEFNTYVRVAVQAQVIEAADSSLIGQNAPLIQSLKYVASKKLTLNLEFSDKKEMISYLNTKLCTDDHWVTLEPIRETGTRGVNSLQAKMKASMVSVSGLHITDAKKQFNDSVICKKPPAL